MITVTDEAASKIKETAEDEKIEPTLRMRILGGGCSGFQYDLYFADDSEITSMDEEFQEKGVKIIVDPISMQYLDGTNLGYTETAMSGAFTFNNPNISGSCGCGSSVAFQLLSNIEEIDKEWDRIIMCTNMINSYTRFYHNHYERDDKTVSWHLEHELKKKFGE